MAADDRYQGEDGGLYGGGLNEPPATHRSAAIKELAKIQPLDPRGDPSAGGKIGFVSVGMSNTSLEFTTFKQMADKDTTKTSRLVFVNGAQSGLDAGVWATTETPWLELGRRLRAGGLTPQQVQIAWVKQAIRDPKEPFPAEARTLQGHLATILNRLKRYCPNVRVAYLSSRIYAGYTGSPLNPEPHAYESAFSVRWVLQDQIEGNPALICDEGSAKSPLLLWGPYLWADGLSPRSDGLTWGPDDFEADGTYPNGAGCEKVVTLLLNFFKSNPLAAWWTPV